jgi:hypothetical protein
MRKSNSHPLVEFGYGESEAAVLGPMDGELVALHERSDRVFRQPEVGRGTGDVEPRFCLGLPCGFKPLGNAHRQPVKLFIQQL